MLCFFPFIAESIKRFNTKNKNDEGRMLSSILFNLYIVLRICINPKRPPYHPLCTPAHLTCFFFRQFQFQKIETIKDPQEEVTKTMNVAWSH